MNIENIDVLQQTTDTTILKDEIEQYIGLMVKFYEIPLSKINQTTSLDPSRKITCLTT